LKEFDELLNQDNKNHSPKASSWFAAVKQFFQG
jgi:hypothetical protein